MSTHTGCTVVTVFAGVPPARTPLSDWDLRCGFTEASQAVLVRRDEDWRALSLMDASPLCLDFVDSQYGQELAVPELARVLSRTMAATQAQRVLLPMGLFHTDHMVVHEAALTAAGVTDTCEEIWLYEDIPYRDMPGLLQQRLGTLALHGLVTTPVPSPSGASDAVKTCAVQAYASQLRGLGAKAQAALTHPERGPERFWAIDKAFCPALPEEVPLEASHAG